jgi:hypothetical protein
MNLKNRLNIISCTLVLSFLFSGKLVAEGTHELSPTASDSAMLHTNAMGFGNFASYISFGTTSALKVRIKNFSTDSLYVGLSAEADDFGAQNSSYQFRILDPTGAVAFGPFTIGLANNNAGTWALAYNGPDVNGAGGYSTNTGTYPYSRFKPTMNGDYTIQFDDGSPFNIVNILWYDFTVRSGGVPQTGRVYSKNWALRTPPIMANTPPECQFDRPFNGVFYSYTTDGFVSKIDFNGSGFQGLSFTVAFGDRGPGTTGNVMEDRRSVKGVNATDSAAVHLVFLNDPDNTEFPSSLSQCGDVSLLGVDCITTDSFCIKVGVTKPGQVEVILDFNNNGIYDINTTDVILAMFFDVPDTVCIPWNGLKGDGSPIAFGESIPLVIRYAQGVQHYAAFDVEYLKNGFCVQTIRPICAGMATNLLYWDDTKITDDISTVTIDEGDPGTGQPKVQFNGCVCGVANCRTWDNFQIGDPPTGTCVGTPYGYGDNNTLNTWWFASTLVINNIFLPFIQVNITGDSAICAGTSTVFTAEVFPDTISFNYSWSGPGGFTAATPTTGFISTAGMYYVTITDPISNCTAIDSQLLIINQNPATTISFTCLGSNQQNANVDLSVSGGLPPYMYLWSNGAMTQDLTNIPPGTYTVIVTDANGCMAFDTVTVQGCCALVVTCPPANGGTFNCVNNVPVADPSVVTVNQYCDSFTITSSQTDNGGAGCAASPLVITRTYMVQDNAGNTTSCVQTFTVIDAVAPTITCPPNITIQCTASTLPANTGTATGSDNCSGTPVITFTDLSVAGPCPQKGTITRTWKATDNCGNTNTCNQTIFVDDSTPPSIVCPPNVTVLCTASTLPANTGTASSSDNCDGAPVVTFTDVTVAGVCAQERTITRTWKSTDACGNSSTCNQIIFVDDNAAPSITCPPNVTIQCSASSLPANTGTATATDNCTGSPTITFADVTVSGSCPVLRTINRTWTAADGCGNNSTCLQVITVIDNSAPQISCPPNITIQCTSSTLPATTGNPTGTDNCDLTLAFTFSDVLAGGACPQRLTITRTWFATDDCGNSSSCVQVIMIDDSTPPVITCPANVTIQCSASTLPANTGTPTATDNCDAVASLTFSDVTVIGACPQARTITRTWVATDDCGNTSSCVQSIFVIDNTPPAITCPPNVTINCNAITQPANTGVATATDNCDGAPIITFSDAGQAGGCPQASTITRTWFATDHCGNSSSCVQLININDSTPPSISCPQNITIECTASTLPANTGTATGSDNCDALVAITFSDITAGGACPQELTITRTWVATDDCGNTSSCVQTIFVDDSTAPVLTCPANITIQCTASTLPANTGTATAIDNCDATPTITFTDVTAGGSCPQKSTITRTWNAVDDCGNSATCVQTIFVDDSTPPVITCPQNITIECTASTLPDNTGSATATDCDLTPTITFTDQIAGGACPQESTISRTWIATDDCGNSSTCLQTIFIDDSTPPVISCPGDITIQCTASTLPANTGSPSATDNCDGTPNFSFTDVTVGGACPQERTITRTWVAADDCGNSSSCTQTIVVDDSTPPVITCPANLTIQCTSSTLPSVIGNATAIDNCDAIPAINFTDVITPGSCPQAETITRTFSATDDCGNSSTCVQVISVVDQTPPVALCHDITVDFGGGSSATITPAQIDNGSSDACGPVTLALSQTEFNCSDFINTNAIPVTLTVTDGCGNTSSCQANVFGTGGVLAIHCPTDITINLGPGECSAFVNYVVTADALCGGTPTLVQSDNTGLTSGDAFPIGTTQQCWTAFNNSSSVECCFNIIVVEYDIPVVMACNDTVQVSVDQNCEAHIFVDMILEGNSYGCYNGFIISIDSIGSDTGWIVFDAEPWIGRCYTVTITDIATGNSCWGRACLEDKIPPKIVCACPPGSDGGDTCTISCLEVQQLIDGNIPPNLYPTVIENCGYDLTITNIDHNDQGCGAGTVIVSWLATDHSGNTATCDQEFKVLPLSADSLVFPPNYIGPCGSSSDPSVTGWPTIGGYNLTYEQNLCNLFVGYWDKALIDCGGGKKILRTWTVLDWCTQQLTEGKQIIKLSDTEGPTLVCHDDITVGTDFWYCYASVSVPKPIAYDNCSDVVTYSLESADGTVVVYGNNYVIQGLETGTHYVTWTVTDLCGNSSTCSLTITVVDNVVPVANCDAHTVVGLTNDGPLGITLVPAEVFDDGSYDNCGPVTFRARRLTSCIDYDWTTEGGCIDDIPNGVVNNADLGTSLKPCVPFACCDVPKAGSRVEPIQVELEVTDQAGNRNYCIVEVEVQDKLSPFIECPPDILVSCDFWFPAVEGTYRDAAGNWNGHLDEDPLSPIFGDMWDALANNDDESVRQPIFIDDSGNPQYSQPHFWGKDGWADDNCQSDLEVRVKIYNDCTGDNLPGNPPPGAVKLIERRFSARDNQQGFNPAVCTQRIWVVDFTPFYISDKTCYNDDPNDGVIWPCDVLITNCPDDFSNTGEPIINSDACNLIGVTYEDTRFEISDGACYKILRDWKVIDWCQYNSQTGHGLWSYTQVIKVHDKDAPQFLNCPAGPVILCVADEGVRLPPNNQAFLGENDPNASSCSVHVTLKQRIRETCDGKVKYDVKIYPFNGNEFLQVVPLTDVTLDDNHEADLVFNTEESAIQSIRKNGLPYNSKWCGDYHKILWSVSDGCGNWSHCQYLIRLEDCKQPSPVCIQGLSTVVMPLGCQVTLWAKDFNASSFDDCTHAADLIYSFDGDTYQPSKTFNQTNIPAFGVELSINIWVADEGTDDNCDGVISWSERNKDYCTTTIVFTDNSGNCDQSGSIVYEGEILTPQNDPVGTVKVSLNHNNESVYAMTTADNGRYVLVVPQVDGQRYDIVPERLDQPRNGVSTLDLVRIQKHLLGKEVFDSPFQYIAADANNSESVSAIDLVEIRKLILGIYTAFPNNESWRFVDKSYQFQDVTHPWPFAEIVNIQYDGHSVSNLDFVGVKIGDVNNSAQSNATQVKPRNGNRIMQVHASADQKVEAGQTVEVEFTLPELVEGFQWTLETRGLTYAGVQSDDINIGDQNIGLLDNGVITMSWNKEDISEPTVQSDMTFKMKFKVTQAGTLSDMIRMSDKIAHAEAYTPGDETIDARLVFGTLASTTEFALYQNEPNPWTGTTTISFDLPEEGKVKLSLYDLTGKQVKVIEGEYKAGRQSIVLQKKDVPAQGVLYYRLDSGNYSATKKMIRID